MAQLSRRHRSQTAPRGTLWALENHDVIAALRHDGIAAPCLSDGAINGAVFLAWVQKSLVPALKPGEIVIMDNLGSHRGKVIRGAIREAGAKLFFLQRHLKDFSGILQADAYSGYNGLYDPGREKGAIVSALCCGRMRGASSSNWPTSPPTQGAANRRHLPDRASGGETHRRAVRHRALHQWPIRQRAPARPPKAKRAALGRSESLAGRRGALPVVALGFRRQAHRLSAQALGPLRRFPWRRPHLPSNNSAERALRGFALGRKSWLFAGSKRGADRTRL